MIRLRKYEEADRSAVLALSVATSQVPFVGEVAELLQEVEGMHRFVIESQDEGIVGFFRFDTNFAKSHEFASKTELGLRSFFIDQRYQGRGFGQQACKAIYEYATQHFADYYTVVLTVNCKNPSAIHAYSKAGFIDAGELYLGGDAGPQHIMRMALNKI
ncbi:GNAT family N-acetyltransferase [Reinekea forsetii]|nr:GNAT family N-acetyltransferase [Reinekea forsetii]